MQETVSTITQVLAQLNDQNVNNDIILAKAMVKQELKLNTIQDKVKSSSTLVLSVVFRLGRKLLNLKKTPKQKRSL
jgi:hypothetical protein